MWFSYCDDVIVRYRSNGTLLLTPSVAPMVLQYTQIQLLSWAAACLRLFSVYAFRFSTQILSQLPLSQRLFGCSPMVDSLTRTQICKSHLGSPEHFSQLSLMQSLLTTQSLSQYAATARLCVLRVGLRLLLHSSTADCCWSAHKYLNSFWTQIFTLSAPTDARTSSWCYLLSHALFANTDAHRNTAANNLHTIQNRRIVLPQKATAAANYAERILQDSTCRLQNGGLMNR